MASAVPHPITLSAPTAGERLIEVVQLRKLLQLEHNGYGKQYRDGVLTEVEMDAYRKLFNLRAANLNSLQRKIEGGV